MNKRSLIFLGSLCGLILTLALTPGCATKNYVKEQMAPIEGRLETVEQATADNKAGIDKNAEDIQIVAASAAEGINELDMKIDGVIVDLAEVMVLAQGKLNYAAVFTDDSIRFGFNQWDLSDETMATLDGLADKLISANKNVYIEILGHTDSIGTDKANLKVGKYRACAVAKYLYGKGIPLHRISFVTMGKANPVADNSTAEGRAENRRVTIRILE